MFTTYLLATSWLWYFILLHFFYLLTSLLTPTLHTHTNYFLLPFTSLHYVTLGPFLDHTWTYWPTNEPTGYPFDDFVYTSIPTYIYYLINYKLLNQLTHDQLVYLLQLSSTYHLSSMTNLVTDKPLPAHFSIWLNNSKHLFLTPNKWRH